MDTDRLRAARTWVREELFENCLPFWLKNGMDPRHGGIFTCLDRGGRLYGSDKSVWFQGRAAWIFSRLCTVYGRREEWLEAAKSCINFMDDHCFASPGGRMYFSVTGAGRPLRIRRYHFSEMFYAIACAEYYGLTGERDRLERAREAYWLAWNLYQGTVEDISGIPPKVDPAVRKTISLSEPLMFLNTTNVLRRFDMEHKAAYDEVAQRAANIVLQRHCKFDMDCVLENVGEDGTVLRELPMGRLMNPGHVIEASWFLLEEAAWSGNGEMREAAVKMFDCAYTRGWDKTYGGLFSFIDIDGLPPEQYEHDMKFWWPHNELLNASLMLYRDTKDEKYLRLFFEALAYSRGHFSDPEFGEWYGYLHRDGTPTVPAPKGNLFKGPFHLPRMLIMLDTMLGELIDGA
jgi:N-acylglucosamine 2-epimerase